MPKTTLLPYTVLADTREQLPWRFPPDDLCLGVERIGLKTGDYTLKGYEHVFVVERKGSTGEVAQNIVQKRFEAELERMQAFPHRFVVCEFTMADVFAFPTNSGIPKDRWPALRITPQFLVRRLNELQLKYATPIVFAGAHARDYVSSLFKRVTEHVQPQA